MFKKKEVKDTQLYGITKQTEQCEGIGESVISKTEKKLRDVYIIIIIIIILKQQEQ